jgi:ABC-type sugar transport system ATPase subunit
MQLYDYPANVFVAGFIGSPAMNFIPGTIDEAGNFLDASGLILIPHASERLNMQKGSNVILGVRPEDIRVAQPEGSGSVPDFKAEILNVEQMGNESLLYVRAGDYELVARIGAGHKLAMTGSISLYFQIGNVHYFDPGSGERLSLIHK